MLHVDLKSMLLATQSAARVMIERCPDRGRRINYWPAGRGFGKAVTSLVPVGNGEFPPIRAPALCGYNEP